MPTDDGLGLHDAQDVGLTFPDAARRRPEEPVQGVECRPWAFPLAHAKLLTEGEDFEGGVAAAAEEEADRREDGEYELEHKRTLVK